MTLANIIKLGIGTTALLLLPRRSSPQADKLKSHKLKHPNQVAAHKHDHNTYSTNDNK